MLFFIFEVYKLPDSFEKNVILFQLKLIKIYNRLVCLNLPLFVMIEEQKDAKDRPHEFRLQQPDFIAVHQKTKKERRDIIKPKRQQKKILTEDELIRREEEKDAKKLKKIEKSILQKVIEQVDAPQKGGVSTEWKIKGELLQICNILKYMLGEFALEAKVQYQNPQHKTFQRWQVKQVIKQIDNTNLGDFMIKLPNPDNLPDEWKDKYRIYEQGGTQRSKFKSLSISQALEFYYDLFDLQTSSKLQSEKQNVAFLIAFYVLKYKSSFQAAPDPIADSFLKVYQYYKLVENLSIKQYIQLRQQENFYDKQEYVIEELFKHQYSQLTCFQDGEPVQDYHEAIWRILKNLIYANLNEEILKKFGQGSNQQQQECATIFGKVKSISQLLKTFPDLIQNILNRIKDFERKSHPKPEEQDQLKLYEQDYTQKVIPLQESKEKTNRTIKDQGLRDLFWGGYLKKAIIQQDVIWVNTKGRPNDVATLLRFCLLYKLVIKSKLYVRMFLNRDETHIMLVVKASEEVLQNYAQKNKSFLEVELGASDLFSFQPVDEYMRPLRKHKYITDKEFMKKYNIKQVVQQNKQQINSIESQAINIYQKAQLMNEDQLRSLIIKDQLAANQMYDWICKKLGIDYVSQKVLNNDYNKDTTDRQTWQLYYVYNKLITSFMKRVKELYSIGKNNKSYYTELEGNVGMILRLMFLKAQSMCNDMYEEHREERSIFPRFISNMWTQKYKLKNIWNNRQIQRPSSFHTYYKMQKYERLWRKFEINELKQRSKFFPSERLMVTNKIMEQVINMSISFQKKHIIDYYPLHDPFILKSIEIEPYLSVIKNIDKKKDMVAQDLDASTINKLYSLYECELTVSDFTKTSIEKQLQFNIFTFKSFQTNCIRYYCGQKIAFYFVLIKYLALKAWPLLLPAFIIQCLLWAQNIDILAIGTSSLTQINNVLIVIWTFINLYWTTHLIQSWKSEESKLAQQYGCTNISVNQIKRVKFIGSFKRDFETDELNFEYVPRWKSLLKGFFTVVINLAYVGMVTEVILLIFVFKTYLYQSGYSQTVVQQGPAILIAIVVQIFTKIYTILIKSIINFQNHKTVAEYEGSLITKVSLITFVINFYSIFIYAYFSGYLSSSYICEIKTTVTNVKIQSCEYFVSSQLTSLIMVDFLLTLVGGVSPYLIFKLKEWWRNRIIVKTSKFNRNYFESIDTFFQEQDKLDSYMYNQQLDSSWLGFMNIVNVFAATALFAPALPFTYVMMFLTGIVRLHASKYDVIYLKRRILPVKSNSIDRWLTILQIISYISMVTNIAYLIYTRNVYPEYQARIFFVFVILFFAIKYFLISQYTKGFDMMDKRSKMKINDILMGRAYQRYSNTPEEVNTDIQNVIYDENKLLRKFHNVKGPNVKDILAKDLSQVSKDNIKHE